LRYSLQKKTSFKLLYLMNNLIIQNFQCFDLDFSNLIIYILVCIPLLFVGLLICFMNETGNQQGKVYDTDHLAIALGSHIGSRCIEAGYTFKISSSLSQDNITLIYICNYGNNIAWFHLTPGYTKIDPTLIARISSLKMDVPVDFKINRNVHLQ